MAFLIKNVGNKVGFAFDFRRMKRVKSNELSHASYISLHDHNKKTMKFFQRKKNEIQ